MKLQWTFVGRSLCGCMFSFLFRKCLGESTGSNNKYMFNFIRNAKLFNKVIAILRPHKQCMRVPVAPHAYEHLELSATPPVWIDIFFQICDSQKFSPIVLFLKKNSQQCLVIQTWFWWSQLIIFFLLRTILFSLFLQAY